MWIFDIIKGGTKTDLFKNFEERTINENTSVHSIPLGTIIEMRDGTHDIIEDFSFDTRSGFMQYGVKLFSNHHYQYFITHMTRNAKIYVPIPTDDETKTSDIWMNLKPQAYKEIKRKFPNLITNDTNN